MAINGTINGDYIEPLWGVAVHLTSHGYSAHLVSDGYRERLNGHSGSILWYMSGMRYGCAEILHEQLASHLALNRCETEQSVQEVAQSMGLQARRASL